jgi:hypothetical protein
MSQLLYSVILFVVSNCGSNKVADQDFVGKWKNPSYGYIILENNHKVIITDAKIKHFWNNEYGENSFCGEGSWQLLKNKNEIVLTLTKTNIQGLTQGFETNIEFYFVRNKIVLYKWAEEEGGEKITYNYSKL